jgi:hypothetical protein
MRTAESPCSARVVRHRRAAAASRASSAWPSRSRGSTPGIVRLSARANHELAIAVAVRRLEPQREPAHAAPSGPAAPPPFASRSAGRHRAFGRVRGSSRAGSGASNGADRGAVKGGGDQTCGAASSASACDTALGAAAYDASTGRGRRALADGAAGSAAAAARSRPTPRPRAAARCAGCQWPAQHDARRGACARGRRAPLAFTASSSAGCGVRAPPRPAPRCVRKTTSENGRRDHLPPRSARTHRRELLRELHVEAHRSASPSAPKARITIHSLRARKRRPSCGP